MLALCCGWFISSSKALEAGQRANANRYVNCDFGYSMEIPSGLTAKTPEYYNHGFVLHLPDRESSIEIYNAYNMSESRKPEAVFDYVLNLRKDQRKNWRVINKRSIQVDGLDSAQATARYERDGAQWKSEILIAYRATQADGLGDIVYLIELTGPAARYDEAIPYFNETVKGFQLTKLPRGKCSNE